MNERQIKIRRLKTFFLNHLLENPQNGSTFDRDVFDTLRALSNRWSNSPIKKIPFDVFDCFNRESGSKQWPSTSSLDSPSDIFACKYCGANEKIQMYGSCPIENTFEDKARKILVAHIQICKEYNK